MIEFSGIGKRYGDRPGRARVDALHGVSLRIENGETVAVLGPNGAGKSTLLGIALGFLHPSAGAVSIHGLPPRRFVRQHGVAWLPERFSLPAEWPVLDALTALARLERPRAVHATAHAREQRADTNAADARERARIAMERFGLAAHARRTLGTLSRGLLQRVGLAQTVLAPHRVAVLDEPTEGLDPEGRLLFRELAAELRAAGTTVIVASQDLPELDRIADRAILLEAGRVRDVLIVDEPAPRGLWTIRLASPHPALTQLFPGARRLDNDTHWTVTCDDARDLSHRLAALITAGALILDVVSGAPTLEERVRDAFGAPAAPDQADAVDTPQRPLTDA